MAEYKCVIKLNIVNEGWTWDPSVGLAASHVVHFTVFRRVVHTMSYPISTLFFG
jgi:hypothetical protein